MNWYVEELGEFYECAETSMVYFDPASGNTHQLGDFAAYIVKKLSSGPMTTSDLIEKISPDVDSSDLAEISRALPALLEHLVSLDIVCLS
jgi:hypothetical protein